MFERFTDRARRVVVLAQEEARMLGHNYIGTEHVLLGLLHEGEGIAARVMLESGLSLEVTRAAVEQEVGRGSHQPGGHIPFTPKARSVMELSLRQALQLGHPYIGTEHLLLGLLEHDDVGRYVLEKTVEAIEVRKRVIAFLAREAGLGSEPPETKPEVPHPARIENDYCGQGQPHGAHVWQVPRPHLSTNFASPRQCAGLAAGDAE